MRIKRNKFISGVIILFTGTAFAQLLNIILSPIVTRLYTPEEFGIVAIFSVFLVVLGISTLKFEVAIPITNTNRQAINLIIVSAIVSIFLNAIVLFIIIIFRTKINEMFGFDDNPNIVFLIPLGALLISFFNITRQWTIKQSEYSILSRATVTQSIGGNVTKIIFGLASFGTMGLIISRIVSGSLGILTLSKSLISNYKTSFSSLSLNEITQIIIRYKKFAIYMTPNSLLIIVIAQIPVLIMGILYGPEITGYYSLAQTIIMLPLAIIGDSIGNVFYSESSKIVKQNPNEVIKLSYKLVFWLFFISLIPGLILYLYGPLLFTVVFGEAWYLAGVYSQVLILVLITRMTLHPLNKIFELIEKQKDKLYLNIIQVILLGKIFIYSLTFEVSPVTFLFMYSIVVSSMNVIIFIWSQILLKKYKKVRSQ